MHAGCDFCPKCVLCKKCDAPTAREQTLVELLENVRSQDNPDNESNLE